MSGPARASTFAYRRLEIDPGARTVTCHYSLDDEPFVEVATFDEAVDLAAPGVEAVAVLYLLLAGLSYYKAGAARVVDLGALEVGGPTRALLTDAIVHGLAEFAHRNALDLTDVAIVGGSPTVRVPVPTPTAGPLVPFGGGIDSIVTASAARRQRGAALFVVSPGAGPLEAIERSARALGLPVVRCGRTLDPGLRRAGTTRFDGHVPVTAIVSSLALIAAVATGHDAVAMSNARSASSPTLVGDGQPVNHQWSKSLACEDRLRAALDERLEPSPAYASALRDRSELWVAAEFARHDELLDTFMSCNRAFRQDPSTRAPTWCGECDKCLFTDLVLSPFVTRERLEGVFGGREPLGDPARVPDLEVLCGVVDHPRPFECVGDADECATALVAAASRPDRAAQPHLAALASRCPGAKPLDELLAVGGPTHSSLLDAARDLV